MTVCLNHRAQFWRYAEGQSGTGQRKKEMQPVPVGTPDNHLWCDVRYPSGMQVIAAGGETSIVRASIVLLYREGIDAGMHVEAEGRMHEIESVAPDRRNNKLTLVAKVVNIKS